MRSKTVKLVTIAMLIALGFVLINFVHTPLFPSAPYLVYTPGDIPILIGALSFGPVAGLIMTAIISLLQMLFLSTDGIIGFIMHFAATGSLVIVASLICRKDFRTKRLIISLLISSLVMVAVMLPTNYFIQLYAYGLPREAIFPILPIVAAFNSLKALINSIITFIIIKPISSFLKNKTE